MTAIVSLKGSLEPLRWYFNDNEGMPRFLALVSPTCSTCLRGLRAVRSIVEDASISSEVLFIITWIDMLGRDNERTAARASRQFIDGSLVKEFHDPTRVAGREIARSIGGEGKVAWDTYLVYEPKAVWLNEPPTPYDWVHQLRVCEWADARRLHRGRALSTSVGNMLRRLMEDEGTA